jgi:hypothetical protein
VVTRDGVEILTLLPEDEARARQLLAAVRSPNGHGRDESEGFPART